MVATDKLAPLEGIAISLLPWSPERWFPTILCTDRINKTSAAISVDANAVHRVGRVYLVSVALNWSTVEKAL